MRKACEEADIVARIRGRRSSMASFESKEALVTMSPTNVNCTESSRPPKRSNIKSIESVDDNEDRISSLPDHLLLHIISFLDMDQAVITGILSTRWRDLWIHTPNLQFSESKSPQSLWCCNFIKFVEQSLSLHIAINIHKFSLRFSSFDKHFSYLNDWLRLAVMKGVRELRLQFSWHQCCSRETNIYGLPSWLFQCDELVSLELHLCKVEVLDDVCFSSLRVLSLIQIEVSGHQIEKLLGGCPLLEDLTIICHIAALKHENGYSDMKSLPENLRHPKVLTLCRQGVQMMSISHMRNLHSYMSETKCLSLTTSLHKGELPGIANSLRISNELETLIIRFDAVHLNKSVGKDRWERLTFGFPCLMHHLKTIKITGLMQYEQYYSDIKYRTRLFETLDGKMSLLRFLVKNAKILQKVIIHLPKKYGSRNIGEELRSKIKWFVFKKLIATFGVSSCAQVLFSDD